jgi:hypothetical protein
MNTTKKGSVRYIVFQDDGVWYAVGLEFYEGNTGRTKSDNIEIPSEGEIVLTYNYAIEVEKLEIYDLAELRLFSDNKIVNIWQKTETTEMKKDAQTASINLNQYRGKTVQLEAFFDTVDNLNNSTLGWQILDLKIENTSIAQSSDQDLQTPPEDQETESEDPIDQEIDENQDNLDINPEQDLNNENPTPQPPQNPTTVTNSQVWKLSTSKPASWQKQNHPNLPFIQNLWTVQTAPNTSLVYGSGGQYDNGQRNAGSLVSPPIQLPAGRKLELKINHQINVENSPNWDRASVFVRPAGSNNGTRVWLGGSAARTDTKIDLSSFAGQNIQVEFRFDTIDKFFNVTNGWQVFEATIE